MPCQLYSAVNLTGDERTLNFNRFERNHHFPYQIRTAKAGKAEPYPHNLTHLTHLTLQSFNLFLGPLGPIKVSIFYKNVGDGKALMV